MITTALKEADLVQLEYALLVFVDDVPGISQQSLSEALGIDRNNVSLIADKLEARGLLKRAVNGADRRARELYITPEGRKLYRDHRVKVRQANDRILSSLTAEEKELFLDMLVRVVEGNRIHARPGGGRRKRGSVKSSVTRSEAWSCHVERVSYLHPCLPWPSALRSRFSPKRGRNARSESLRRFRPAVPPTWPRACLRRGFPGGGDNP